MTNRQISADILQLTTRAIDIKLLIDGQMHILQWRRNMFWDAVLVDGKAQHKTAGLWGRETVFGLVFGQDENGRGGERMILTVDPSDADWTGMTRSASGVRLETATGPLIAHGTLDPKTYEKPKNWSEYIRKKMGVEW